MFEILTKKQRIGIINALSSRPVNRELRRRINRELERIPSKIYEIAEDSLLLQKYAEKEGIIFSIPKEGFILDNPLATIWKKERLPAENYKIPFDLIATLLPNLFQEKVSYGEAFSYLSYLKKEIDRVLKSKKEGKEGWLPLPWENLPDTSKLSRRQRKLWEHALANYPKRVTLEELCGITARNEKGTRREIKKMQKLGLPIYQAMRISSKITFGKKTEEGTTPIKTTKTVEREVEPESYEIVLEE
jgi:hypothetical protein